MIKRILHGIGRYFSDLLSLERMSEEYHVLAINYIYLMAYAVLESVFVNTLLYRITPDISIVILYRSITYVVSAVAMHVSAYLCQKRTPTLVIRLGGLLYLLMYAVLFFGMDYMKYLMYVTAALAGMAGAFYWSGHNMLVAHYTNSANRDIAISVLGIIQGVASLLIPVICGSAISLTASVFNSPAIGYRVIFGIAMLVVGTQVWYQRKLSPIVQTKHKSELGLALSLLRDKASYKLAMAYELLRGFRDGTFGFILNILLFEIITSESLVGFNAFLSGVMAIIGAWAYGKLVTVRLRVRYIVFAASTLVVFLALLLQFQHVAVVMLFSMLNSFFSLFITSSASNTTFDIMTQTAADRACMAETVAIREVFLALGRILGLALLVLFPSSLQGRIWAMIVLTAAQYLMGFFMKLTQNSLARSEPVT